MTIWQLDAPQEEALHWTDTNVTRVAFSPNSEWVAASGDYYTVYLGRARAAAERRDIDAQQGQIFVTEFSPDSTLLATAGIDGRARLWDVESGEQRGTDLEHASPVMAGHFMPDGTRLITSTLNGSIYVWDWETGQRLPGPTAPHSAHVYLDLSGDGHRLASFSWDHRVKVWDTTSWQELAAHTHREQVTGGVITPNGAYVASLTLNDGETSWCRASGSEVGCTSERHRSRSSGRSFRV